MIAILRGIGAFGVLARVLGRIGIDFLHGVNRFGTLVWQTVSRVHLLFKNPEITISHMYTLGIESLPLVSVIGIFLGSETVIQAVYQMSGFVPLRYLGVLVCKGLTIELGPVITSMVVAGRVATGIAAEIGSMKTTEQIDAMNIMSLDPIRYLIVPKMVACVVMLPILVIWAEFLAFMGSIVTVLLTVDITMHSYLGGLRLFFSSGDLLIGVAKTAIFGGIIAVTGAYFGFETKGGAEGVGNATTKAVVVSAVLILVFDFIIAVLVL